MSSSGFGVGDAEDAEDAGLNLLVKVRDVGGTRPVWTEHLAPQGCATSDRSSNLFEQVSTPESGRNAPPLRVVVRIKRNDGYEEPASATRL